MPRTNPKSFLVNKVILGKGGRLPNLSEGLGQSSDREQQLGRFATHDRVAMCLLRKDLESVLPIRREVRIARNRRRLKVVFVGCIIWWLAGRFIC